MMVDRKTGPGADLSRDAKGGLGRGIPADVTREPFVSMRLIGMAVGMTLGECARVSVAGFSRQLVPHGGKQQGMLDGRGLSD
jgi:hypothetical protein